MSCSPSHCTAPSGGAWAVAQGRAGRRSRFWNTIEYFRDAVFNYPAMAEAFKVAALDGLNKLA
jgi:hypothetical protein